jgi:hypothetical protein
MMPPQVSRLMLLTKQLVPYQSSSLIMSDVQLPSFHGNFALRRHDTAHSIESYWAFILPSAIFVGLLKVGHFTFTQTTNPSPSQFRTAQPNVPLAKSVNLALSQSLRLIYVMLKGRIMQSPMPSRALK